MDTSYTNLNALNRYKQGHWRHHPTEKPRVVWNAEQEAELTPARDGWTDVYLQQPYPRVLFKGQKNAKRFPLGYSTITVPDAEGEKQAIEDGFQVEVKGLQRRQPGVDEIDETQEEEAQRKELERLSGNGQGSLGAAILKERDDLKSEVASLRDAVQQLLAAHQAGGGKQGRKAAAEA